MSVILDGCKNTYMVLVPACKKRKVMLVCEFIK